MYSRPVGGVPENKKVKFYEIPPSMITEDGSKHLNAKHSEGDMQSTQQSQEKQPEKMLTKQGQKAKEVKMKCEEFEENFTFLNWRTNA